MPDVRGRLETRVRTRLGLTRTLLALSAIGLASASLLRPDAATALSCLLAALALSGVCTAFVVRVSLPGAWLASMRSAFVAVLLLDALVAGVAIGAVRLRSLDPPPVPSSSLGKEVALEGSIDGPFRSGSRGWEAPFAIARIDQESGAAASLVGRRVALRVEDDREPTPSWSQGTRLSVKGRLTLPRAGNGDGYDEAAVLRSRGLDLILVTRPRQLTVLGHRAGLAGFVDGVRRHGERSLSRGVTVDESALLRGVILGETGDLDPALLDAFRRSGTAHILSVSGLHVASLAAAVLLLARLAGVRRGRASALALVVILVFTLMTGAGPSVVRAAVMAACALVAWMAGRGRDPWQAFFAAACVVLALDPRSLLAPGFQLSFIAVVGLLALSSVFQRWLEQVVPGWLASALAVSLAAGLATAPVSLVHFGQTSGVAVIANLFVVPIAAPVMALGLASIAGGVVWPSVSHVCNLSCSVLLSWVVKVAQVFARAPVVTRADVGTVAWVAVGLMLSVPLVFAALGRAPPSWAAWSPLARVRVRPARPRHRLAAVLLVLLVGAAGGAATGRLATSVGQAALGARGRTAWPREGEVRVLDVGQGSALLVRTAGHHAALIDGGPAAGGLGRELRRLGVRRLDVVVVTHPHADHFAGLLQDGVPPTGLLVDSVQMVHDDGTSVGQPRAEDREATTYLTFRRQVLQRGGRVVRAQDGWRVSLDEVSIEVRAGNRSFVLRDGPRPWGSSVPAGDRLNDGSLVTIVRSGSLAILDPGDAEAQVLERLRLDSVDMLVVPHHGSRGAVSRRLLDALRPRIACISVGEGNSFGHPEASTLAQLEEAHVQVLRTDRSGSLAFPLGGSASAVSAASPSPAG